MSTSIEGAPESAKTVVSLDKATVRFAGDSGDGMQLTGTEFTRTAALFGNDIATFPDRYGDIDVPVLIVWGREDRIVPALFGLLFEAEIPGSTLHVFDDCGHAPHLEYPVETAVLLRDWMRRHYPRDSDR